MRKLRHRGRLEGLLVALFVLSCSPSPAPPIPTRTAIAPVASAAQPGAAAPALRITVVEDPGADRWTVEYRFARPVMGVRFDRTKERLRAGAWSATADGGTKQVEWSAADKREVLRVNGTQPCSTITLSLPSDSAPTEGDYEQNGAFTDGSRIFYTGHFAIRPIACPNAGPCGPQQAAESPPPAGTDVVWQFRTKADRGIVVLDARGKGELQWSSATVDFAHGTYAYFGNIEPVDTQAARVIADPGLPEWMARSTRELVPKLLDWFAKDMSTPLSFRPLVIVSFSGPDAKGQSSGGGGLPQLIELRASGVDWKQDSPDTREGWIKLLAHELFHSWDAGMFSRKRGAEEYWLSEGSADLFAYRAMTALRILDDAGYRRRVVRAANECLLNLQRRALMTDDPKNRTAYPCGAVLFAWIDGVARGKSLTAGDLLGRVFEQSVRRGDRKYGTDDVFEELKRLAGDPGVVEPFDRILRKGVTEGADELFAKQLRPAGIETTLVPVREADVDPRELPALVGTELARCDCDRRISFQMTKEGLEFNAVPQCKVLAGVRVVAVEGREVPKDYAGALDALITRSADKPVMVRLADRKTPVPVTCRPEAHPMPFKRLLRAR